jgi:hypothetical protein
MPKRGKRSFGKRPRTKRLPVPAAPYRVFVGHATVDKWLATTICEGIETVGAITFRDDRDIGGGDDIPETIRDAIDASDEMVVLLTPASVNRPWVLFEVAAAWQRRAQIVVIRQYVETDSIPAMLQSKKAIDLNDFNRYLDELRTRLRTKK